MPMILQPWHLLVVAMASLIQRQQAAVLQQEGRARVSLRGQRGKGSAQRECRAEVRRSAGVKHDRRPSLGVVGAGFGTGVGSRAEVSRQLARVLPARCG